ncbi:MAG: hypothetical protein WBD16_08515 [Pyrinomonadaceae bacterium]
MKRPISYTRKDGQNISIEIEYPDECPLCHKNIFPIFLTAIQSSERPNEIQTAFRCTSDECDSIFIGVYRESQSSNYLLEELRPKSTFEASFEPTIKDLSPAFVKIYNQAIAAEAHDLDQIVGIGLRKAFEFLIKDFAIYLSPNDADAIKAKWLKNVIDEYIEDPNLKKVAERVTWLGNDETHYERLWSEKDLKDLKRLIHLSLNGIDTVIASAQYIEDMPKKAANKSG